MTGRAEDEPQADLLWATGPRSIVLNVIRRRHSQPDSCNPQTHDDIVGLLNIVERAHAGLQSLRDERDAALARANQAETALVEAAVRLDAVELLLPVLAMILGEPRRDARSAELVAKAVAWRIKAIDVRMHTEEPS